MFRGLGFSMVWGFLALGGRVSGLVDGSWLWSRLLALGLPSGS